MMRRLLRGIGAVSLFACAGSPATPPTSKVSIGRVSPETPDAISNPAVPAATADVSPLPAATAPSPEPVAASPIPRAAEALECPRPKTKMARGSNGIPAPYAPSQTPEAILKKVRIGWTTAHVLEHAGYPTSCGIDTWNYDDGPPTGPRATYRFTIQHGVVTSIGVTAVACEI